MKSYEIESSSMPRWETNGVFYDLQTCTFFGILEIKGLKKGLDTWKKEMQKHYYQLQCL